MESAPTAMKTSAAEPVSTHTAAATKAACTAGANTVRVPNKRG